MKKAKTPKTASKGNASKSKKSSATRLIKKPVKKLVRATSEILTKVTRKASGLAVVSRGVVKSEKKDDNVISFSELLDRKKLKDHAERSASSETRIPPHELNDKIHQQCKPQAHTKLRSGVNGVRHK